MVGRRKLTANQNDHDQDEADKPTHIALPRGREEDWISIGQAECRRAIQSLKIHCVILEKSREQEDASARPPPTYLRSA